MDGDNINAPLLSLDGSCMALSLSQRRPRQASGLPTECSHASAIHLQAAMVTGVQTEMATAIVSIGNTMFFFLKTPSPFPVENNSPI